MFRVIQIITNYVCKVAIAVVAVVTVLILLHTNPDFRRDTKNFLFGMAFGSHQIDFPIAWKIEGKEKNKKAKIPDNNISEKPFLFFIKADKKTEFNLLATLSNAKNGHLNQHPTRVSVNDKFDISSTQDFRINNIKYNHINNSDYFDLAVLIDSYDYEENKEKTIGIQIINKDYISEDLAICTPRELFWKRVTLLLMGFFVAVPTFLLLALFPCTNKIFIKILESVHKPSQGLGAVVQKI